MRLAVATCRTLLPTEVDDTPLLDALRSRVPAVDLVPWDAAIDWSVYRSVLIRTTWDYTSRRDAFVAWADALGDRLHNPPSIVRWNTHKGYLEELAQRGVPVVPTLWLRRGTAPEAPRVDGARAFIKPAIAANAEGTLRFTTGDPAAVEHLRRWLPEHDMMVQPYLASVETAGERSAIVVDGEVTHVIRKVPVPGDYRVQDDWGATDAPHAPSDAEAALIAAAVRALPPGLLYARVDWLLGDDGRPLVNEVECVEPSMFFRHAPHAAVRLADAWLRRVAAGA